MGFRRVHRLLTRPRRARGEAEVRLGGPARDPGLESVRVFPLKYVVEIILERRALGRHKARSIHGSALSVAESRAHDYDCTIQTIARPLLTCRKLLLHSDDVLALFFAASGLTKECLSDASSAGHCWVDRDRTQRCLLAHKDDAWTRLQQHYSLPSNVPAQSRGGSSVGPSPLALMEISECAESWGKAARLIETLARLAVKTENDKRASCCVNLSYEVDLENWEVYGAQDREAAWHSHVSLICERGSGSLLRSRIMSLAW